MTTNHKTTHLFEQLLAMAEGLGQTLAPFCEVVLHDLTDPCQTILAIHNNQSGRALGAPATELGLARIEDPGTPQVIANYANRFADGRPVKSTSIGIRDTDGRYVAALCLNVDLSVFQGMRAVLERFTDIGGSPPRAETLAPIGAEAIRDRIDRFAARLATPPHALKAGERRALLRELKDSGCLDVRRAMDVVARHLGVSRATVYADVK